MWDRGVFSKIHIWVVWQGNISMWYSGILNFLHKNDRKWSKNTIATEKIGEWALLRVWGLKKKFKNLQKSEQKVSLPDRIRTGDLRHTSGLTNRSAIRSTWKDILKSPDKQSRVRIQRKPLRTATNTYANYQQIKNKYITIKYINKYIHNICINRIFLYLLFLNDMIFNFLPI